MITDIKVNQPARLADLCTMDFTECPTFETVGKRDGRLEPGREWVKDLADPEWYGYAAIH